MLRTTVAAFAAGVGGADAVTVLPFDEPTRGSPTPWPAPRPQHLGAPGRGVPRGRRSPTPPAAPSPSRSSPTTWPGRPGPSWGASRTDGERGLRSPRVARRSRARRERATSPRRRRPITGLSEFPDLAEPVPDDRRRRPRRTAYGDGVRGAAARAAGGHVFLATLGTVAAHTARAKFATNLLAAGGVAVDAAGATTASTTCSRSTTGRPWSAWPAPTRRTPSGGATLAAALREAGAPGAWSSRGRPADWADDSCRVGVDAVDFLTRTREALA